MGTAFTGSRGLPTRTKVLIGLLVVVLVGAAGFVLLRRSSDVRARIARGEVTAADAEAMQADPETWVNLVGDVMRERAEAGDDAVVMRLSDFLLATLETMSDEEIRSEYGQVVAWMHGASAASSAISGLRASWMEAVGAHNAVRLRVLCGGFGDLLGGDDAVSLAPTFGRVLWEGAGDDTRLEVLARTWCSQPLAHGFARLAEADSSEALEALAQTLMRMAAVETVDEVVRTRPMSLHALHILWRLAGSEVWNDATPDGTGEGSVWLQWRQRGLAPVVARALDHTPVGAGELWEAVDEEGTPRALALLQEVEDTMAPLQLYGVVDRLLAGGPEAARVRLEPFHAEAAAEAREWVAARVAPDLAGCGAGAPSGLSFTLRVDAEAGLRAAPGTPDWVRPCLETALAEVTVPDCEALVRPLDVPIQLAAEGL